MRPLIDPPLEEGRPMTVRAPTEQNPQPVPHSDWVWWRDKHGFPHARRGQVEVHAPTTKFTALLAEIRKAEGGRREGGFEHRA